MAVGTVTIQSINPFSTSTQAPIAGVGPLKVAVANVQPTSGANYTTGGSAITAAQLGLQRILWGEVNPITVGANGPGDGAVVPQADGSIKLKMQLPAMTGEVAANTDLSAALIQVVVFGY